ncbi:MAG: twin-arginine translocation signal domain-containing protein [Pirellulaceae bacterium]
MAEKATRREFLQVTAAGGALGGWLPGLGAGWSSPVHAADDEPQRPGSGSDRRAVEAEIRRRARWQLEQTRLIVDYYRVGRKIAYPLPLSKLVIPEVRVPSIPTYPWATWLLWTLEERIDCLGWAAEWFGDEQARQAAAADLADLWRSGLRISSTPDPTSARPTRAGFSGRPPHAGNGWGRTSVAASARRVSATWKPCCPPRTSDSRQGP